jgi:hypothetical protein
VNESGTSGFWSTFSPGLNAPIIVVYTGNSTTNATMHEQRVAPTRRGPCTSAAMVGSRQLP